MSEIEIMPNSVVDENLEKFKQSLSKDHVIYTMIIEHEKILKLLNNLFLVNHTIQQTESFSYINDNFKKLSKIINLIINFDLHHQREEKVLFPQLELMGILGHPYVKTLEHEQINDYLEELKTLCDTVPENIFPEWKKRINTLVRFLITKLIENIEDENNYIYPKAVQVIIEDKIWDNMKRDCDLIGYCNFDISF